MPLQRLQLNNFRLFQDSIFSLSNGTNLILGENGSGKTSILESISILLSGSSFRTKETKECISHNRDFYKITATGELKNNKLQLSIENGVNSRLKSSRRLGENSARKEELYFLQIVMAKNLRMIDGEPDIRREYFNQLMFHVKPGTKKLHTLYQKALKTKKSMSQKQSL